MDAGAIAERIGVRRIKHRENAIKFPLIPAFSLKGEGACCLT
jgi:hypothetical protein